MVEAALCSDRSGAVSQAVSVLGSLARMGHATATVLEFSAALFANGTAPAGLEAATTFDLVTEVWRGVELADLEVEAHEGAFLAFDCIDCANYW